MPASDQVKLRSPEEIRAEIERARAQIQSSAQQLKHEMQARADWREWVRRHPAPVLGGAFLLGVWLGSRR